MSLDDFYSSTHSNVTRDVGKLPPVESWNPPLSGDIDIRIDRRGRWFHDGKIIKRQALVDTFASILKREDDDYFLVTPVEKWRIQVAIAPLLVIGVSVTDAGKTSQVISLDTQQGHRVKIGEQHPVSLFTHQNERVPLVLIRANLSAIIERSTFYQLADYAEPNPIAVLDEQPVLGVRSLGAFFSLE